MMDGALKYVVLRLMFTLAAYRWSIWHRGFSPWSPHQTSPTVARSHWGDEITSQGRRPALRPRTRTSQTNSSYRHQAGRVQGGALHKETWSMRAGVEENRDFKSSSLSLKLSSSKVTVSVPNETRSNANLNPGLLRVFRVFIFKAPGFGPLRGYSACAKRAAYPDPPPVVPVPESLADPEASSWSRWSEILHRGHKSFTGQK